MPQMRYCNELEYATLYSPFRNDNKAVYPLILNYVKYKEKSMLFVLSLL